MPFERSILMAVQDPSAQKALKDLAHLADLRVSVPKSIEDCASLLKVRTYLLLMVDREGLRQIEKIIPSESSVYAVITTSVEEMDDAARAIEKGTIQDVFSLPATAAQFRALAGRARQFQAMSGALISIRRTAENRIREDALMLCSGTWAETANRWLSQNAQQHSPVLLAGEAGSGKRLLGRLLHFSSPRAGAPCIIVRCKDRQSVDLEKEVFGQIREEDLPPKGIALRSKFSLAGSGTIIFDKAEELPRRLQQRIAKALRFERFSPRGGGELLPLHARLIFTVQTPTSTTGLGKLFHPDLARLLKKNILQVPPLRDRREDLPVIIRNVLQKIRRDHGVRPAGLTEDALELLYRHEWPGNIRELEGVLWAASVLAGRSNLSKKTLALFLGELGEKEIDQGFEEMIDERLGQLFQRFGVEHFKDLYSLFLARLERPLIRLVLQYAGANQLKASAFLGISRNTLRRKIKEYSLN